MRGRALATALLSLAFGCGESKPLGQGPPPAGWTDGVALSVPVDLDAAPHVLEVNLESRAAPIDLGFAHPTELWSYNGAVPGPLLHARRGDTLIVHFTNNLPEATTIHWHGVRVPVAMDGTPSAQPPVEPGGHFDYQFVLPDAGLFWYHPHLQTTAQVRAGLMGAILVDDDDPAAPPASVLGPEVVLVLSEARVDADGALVPTAGASAAQAAAEAGARNLLLVNGRVNPTLLARRGQRQRWHIANTASSRYFRLVLDGHALVRIGTDGGLRESAVVTSDVVIAPAERVDLLVTPDASVGSDLAVRQVPLPAVVGAVPEPAQDLFTIRIVEDAGADLPPPLPRRLRRIPRLDPTNATQQVLVLSTAVDANKKFTFTVNGAAFAGMEDGAIVARVGETQRWTFENRTAVPHPMHLHGFFFQVLDPATGLVAADGDGEWKDTVDVPAATSLDFLVRYDDRPGMWMYHCHILEHVDLGLMGMLHVNPALP